MKVKKYLAALGALSLVAVPAVAQSALAPALAPLDGDETSLGGEGVLIGVIAGAAIIGGILVVADDNDNQIPVSG